MPSYHRKDTNPEIFLVDLSSLLSSLKAILSSSFFSCMAIVHGDSMAIIPRLPISSSGTEALLFALAFFGWIASEIIGAMVLPRLRRHRTGTKLEIRDKRSGLVVFAGLLAAVYLAFGLSLAGIALLPDWVFYPGIALIFLGIDYFSTKSTVYE